MKFDKYPQSDNVKPLKMAYGIENESLNSIFLDLPFVIRNASTNSECSSMIENRFTAYQFFDELCAVNIEMLQLSHSKLSKGGYLIMKTMDVTFAGKQYWVSDFVFSESHGNGI